MAKTSLPGGFPHLRSETLALVFGKPLRGRNMVAPRPPLNSMVFFTNRLSISPPFVGPATFILRSRGALRNSVLFFAITGLGR